MADDNPQNMNVPSRPEPTHTDQRINPVPDQKERAEREADKIAHKGIEHEHEFDNLQKPFTK
jgi:hypothetical protein